MIRRYSLPEMATLFTEEARWATILEVEVLATEAWASIGEVPAEDAKAVREKAPAIDGDLIGDVDEREAVTNHDLAAFVDVVQQRIGQPAGKWVHYGLTSTDVIDTAQCATLVTAADLLIARMSELYEVLARRAREERNTAMAGRTHGMHAEPTTFGVKAALWALQVARDIERMQRARQAVSVGKLSGAVGTYSNIDPRVEAFVCEKLGLQPTPATQVVARDRHAEYLYACASIGATIETISTEVRHLQRTEVGEAGESFGKGQKGSSAMPHKRNPITAERLSGLARVLRGYLQPAFEDVALWHERDISHSSVERVVLPDASLVAHYMIVKATSMMDNLEIRPQRMLENLDRSLGLVFSQPVLLALVESGLSRDEAYRIVQRNAMQAAQEQRPFRELIDADADVSIPAEQLDRAFSLEWSLRNTNRVFDVLDATKP